MVYFDRGTSKGNIHLNENNYYFLLYKQFISGKNDTKCFGKYSSKGIKKPNKQFAAVCLLGP